ncbi:mitotic-spindle organizing protein 2A [Elysia marginata]|uniref:Mitotic-spindle organizing protein 2A n=1 Tax=Elysia marginata TaxID=1093978 RepID=A0AAV4FQV7_9GAST|nr:mitotic-spindle organizing protein 2A [Elysia marginata]
MESGDQYGPALPPGDTNVVSQLNRVTLHNCAPMDLSNEANFNALLAQPDQEFYPWLASIGLVGSAQTFRCPTCGGACKFVPRANRRLCFTFRCRNSKNHEFSLTKFSFFEKIKVDVRVLLRFVRGYLLSAFLDDSANGAGIVGNVRLDWVSVTRDIFVEVVRRSLNGVRFHKEVEINDALVGTITVDGRSIVHNVWLFGVTHTETSQVLLFPVLARDEVTVVRILQRFVDPGAKVVAEPGSFYSRIDFRCCGFEGVVRTPLQTVRNSRVWAHTKAHFCKFAESTKLFSFESLVCEIIWRSWKRGDLFTNYLSDLKSIYTLRGPPQFTSNARPIFDTWVSSEEYASCNFNFSFMDSVSQTTLLSSKVLTASSEHEGSEGRASSSYAHITTCIIGHTQ